MNEHHHGIIWSGTGFIGWVMYWIVHNIQAIDGVLQGVLLLISIAAASIGLRKVLR